MFEEKSRITGEKSDGILMYTLFFLIRTFNFGAEAERSYTFSFAV